MNEAHKFSTINSSDIGIRLNSLQYGQLREKLQAPIRAARSIVIQQSLSDRFAAAFAEQVERNGVYILPQGSQVEYTQSLIVDINTTGSIEEDWRIAISNASICNWIIQLV